MPASRLTGPFFTSDPEKTVRQNIRDMLVALAAEAQEDVQSRFPVKTGAGRAGVPLTSNRDTERSVMREYLWPYAFAEIR